MPAQIQSMLDVYASRYHVLKTPRKLVWHPQVGTVRLQLEVRISLFVGLGNRIRVVCRSLPAIQRLAWIFAKGRNTELSGTLVALRCRQFEDGSTREFTRLTPLQACIIMRFQVSG